jgi:hypothetical protein
MMAAGAAPNRDAWESFRPARPALRALDASERSKPLIFVLHENAESVPSLFRAMGRAMGRQARVRTFRVVNPVTWARLRRPESGFQWRDERRRAQESVVVVPGLRRFGRASHAQLRRTLRRAVAREGLPDVVVVDSPYLEPVVADWDGRRAYYAPDPFEFYAWPRGRTRELEDRLLEECDVVLAVSERLAADFRERGRSEVLVSPNGVSQQFIDSCEPGRRELPRELASIPRPRVGIVGKINATYDWEMIDELAGELRDFELCFIGPVQERDAPTRAMIERVFARENVHWLGSRKHLELPRYLTSFDALLSPLRLSARNHRRSLLRLAEYVATPVPVVTTALDGVESLPGVCVAHDTRQAMEQLVAAVLGTVEVNMEARRAWLDENTWDARAAWLLGQLDPAMVAK